MRFPKHVKKILWDVDTRTVDQRRHKSFVITRIAEKGALADVRWLKKQFGVRAIKRAVRASRNTSPKTKSYWKII